MALKGDLGTIKLADVFQTLANNQSRGTLIVHDKDSRKRIYFEGGRIILLSSGKRKGLRIGKILLGRKKITQNELDAALKLQETRKEPLGKILIEMGIITEADIQDTVKFQIEEEIYNLLTWTNAQFEFSPDATPTDGETERASEMISLSLDMQALLMEAARRADEWQGIAGKIGSPREVYRATGGGAARPIADEELNEEEAERLLRLFDGTRSIEEVSNETACGSFVVSKAVARFIDAGLLRQTTVSELLESARERAESGDIDKCIRLHEIASARAGDDIEVQERVARTYEQFGKGHMAAAKYNNIGELFLKSGNHAMAAKYFERALSIHAANPEVLDKLFQIYNRMLDVPATIRAGKRLAALYDELGKQEESKGVYEMLLQLDPHDTASRRKLLNTLLDSGQFNEAEQHYENLADDYLAEGRTAQALEVLGKILLIRPLREDVKRRIFSLQHREARRKRMRILIALGAFTLGLALLAVGYEYKAHSLRTQLNGAIAAAASREDYDTEIECLQMVINAYPHSITAWKASREIESINEKKDLFYGKRIKLLTQSAREEEAGGRLDNALAALQRLKDFAREDGARQTAEEEIARIRNYIAEAEALWALAEKYRGENRLKEVFGYNYKIYWEYPKSARAGEVRLPLSITTLPGGAQVYDGAELAGTSPCVIYYPPKRPPVLNIRAKGFVDVKYDVAQNLSPSFEEGWKLSVELSKPLLWRFKAQQPVEAPAVIYKEALILGSRDGFLYRLENATGKLVWKTHLGPLADVVSQPLLLGDRVYAACLDGNLYCVEAPAGKIRWGVKIGGMLRAAPTVSDDGAKVFITSDAGKLAAVSAETGDTVWSVNTGAAVVCSAVPWKGKVFAATTGGTLLCLNQGDGSEVWRADLKAGVSGTPGIFEDRIYVGLWNGAMLCVTAEAGKLVWKYDSRGGISASPVFTEGTVVFGNDDGRLFRLNAADGKEIWQFRARGAIHSTPAVIKGGSCVAFGCSDGALYAVDIADGTPLWKFRTAGPIYSRAVACNGRLFFGSNDDYLYSIDE
jgi:outer membrane protein assembly factor BamB